MANRNHEVGGLGDHRRVRGVRLNRAHQRLRPQARVLLVGHGGDDQPPGVEPARGGEKAESAEHRRHPALHVDRAPAVEPAVLEHRE